MRFYEKWYEKFDIDGKTCEKPEKSTCERYGVKGTESKKEVRILIDTAKKSLQELNDNTAYREASFWEALKTVFNQS